MIISASVTTPHRSCCMMHILPLNGSTCPEVITWHIHSFTSQHTNSYTQQHATI